ALASTVAFGIPGSSSMAIALSGFYILGLETGPQLLTHEIRFVFLMIFTVIAGNLIGTLLGIFVMNPLIRFSVLPANILVPLVVMVIFAGAYASDSSLINIVITLVFGIVGFFMKVLKYSRASLLIGLVLGETIEKNLYLAIQIDGPLFFLELLPLSLLLIAILVLILNVRLGLKPGRSANER
ncbi:MAG: tripartite tricarboxylate transporter permease, partial [Rhodothermales bacterium]|nr:tripartite tricarboxylate transporter permease [Rhodothermales bacterium]